MDVFGIPVLDQLRQKMAWLSQRQSVLADNVANADTPGFTARDLKPIDFEEEMRRQAFERPRDPGLQRMRDPLAPKDRFEMIETPSQQASPNGNSVALEEQMIKVAETQMEFSAASSLYKRALGLIRLASGAAQRG